MRHTTRALVAFALVLSLTTLAGAAVVVTGQTADAAGQAASLSTVSGTFFTDATDTYAQGVIDIMLGEPITVSGEGAAVSGTTVSITAAGVYRLSGMLADGHIEVNAKGKVYLELDGVDITSSAGPALLITDAKKVTLTLAGGTINHLSDAAGEGEYDAALFTNDTLVINGGGTLVVTGKNDEGISSDDDIIINSGTVRVTAVEDALSAHDDITINGGDLWLTGGEDGIDSNGTVHVHGGSLACFGGPAGGDAGIDAIGELVITGGTVIAAGDSMAAPGADSSQCSIYVSSPSLQKAGTEIVVARDGKDVFRFVPDSDYQNVLVSSSELIAGANYDVYFGTAATPARVVAAATPGVMGLPGTSSAGGAP